MIMGNERITVHVATKTEICRSRTKLRWAQSAVKRPGAVLDR